MRYWVHGLALTDTVVDPTLFNEDMTAEQFRLMISDIIDKDPTDITVKSPGKFTNSIPWLNWKETMVAFMNTKTGAARVPFTYVIRDNVIPTAGVAYTSDIQRHVHETVHHGPTFQKDNATLFGLIQASMLGGPGAPHIQPFELTHDGRGAWKALLAHFESSGFTNKYKQAFLNSCLSARYNGNSKSWTFEQYIATHMTANQNLKTYQEEVSEDRQVRDFRAMESPVGI